MSQGSSESSKTTAMVQEIQTGYAFEGEAVELGALVVDDTTHAEAPIRIPLSMLNRHGLVAGATGTGKTKTLQVMAEQISAAGVPVFVPDVKGDLTGLAAPGESSDKLLERAESVGQDWSPAAAPVEVLSLGGEGVGVPIRTTVSSMGPTLLAKMLDLSKVQESSLVLVFHYADQAGLPLVDLPDLRALLTFLVSDEGKPELEALGGISKQTAGVILRELVAFSAEGADAFFGEPEFDTLDLLRTTDDGLGVISLLELPSVIGRPVVFSTFLVWLLADLYTDLPEVGDVDKPKLVFFLDEAHLLFKDASKAFLESITQTVRLIRSKGVGVFFITQTPTDIDDDVLAQLGSRVQHQLRAHTPNDAKALKRTVSTYPTSDYDLSQVLQELGIGEAIITVMDPDGAPTPVAWTKMRAPQSSMSVLDESTLVELVDKSPLMQTYGQRLERESAQEMLAARLAAGAESAAREQNQESPQDQVPDTANEPAPASQPAPRPRPDDDEDGFDVGGMVSKVWNSRTVRQFARSAGREVVRSIFGTARRR